MDFLKENIVFLRECLQDFDNTGSICPTSKWAAQALIAPLRGQRGKMRILEAGPGTGSVTVHILEAMRADDELVICEINPRFMQALKENLADHPAFIRNKQRIQFFEGPVQNLPSEGKFDVIICAIPFLNLPVEITREIFRKFCELSHPETLLTYYEYMGLRRIGKVVSPERRRRVTELESFLSTLGVEVRRSKRRVWLNVLPVNVYKFEGLAA
ncbi:MAG: methyltransferase domain-containing protein [Proteobacteria bacterium]|nr:methyltransferase domain-containing protein [Pseudomonadota bacterium]